MAAPSSDRAAIRQVIRALKKVGYVPLRVFDGEDVVEAYGGSENDVIAAIMAVDDATLAVTKGEGDEAGWVRFVMGNEPDEVVCDHTVGLSHVLDPLTEGWWS